jgi:hypothetical protein
VLFSFASVWQTLISGRIICQLLISHRFGVGDEKNAYALSHLRISRHAITMHVFSTPPPLPPLVDIFYLFRNLNQIAKTPLGFTVFLAHVFLAFLPR